MVDRKKMEGHCSAGQSPQWAVVPMEEEENCAHIYIRVAVHTSSKINTTAPL